MMKRYQLLPLVCLLASASFGQCPGTTVTVYSNDFEAGDGGLVSGGYGDWAWGATPSLLLGTACTSTYNDPPGPYSGANGWATVLNDCYANADDTSTLALTVDLSDPTFTSAELEWAHWWEYFTNFDYAWVTVNGAQVYFNDSQGLSPAWSLHTIDLTQYVGQASVQVVFHLFATTVVNKAGWYIDDVSVTACSVGNVAVPEAAAPLVISTYPNPASDVLVVGTTLTGAVTFTLTDAAGRLVHQFTEQPTNGQVLLDVARFAPGTYTLTGTGVNGRAISRLVRR